jgi:hypothetical protein
MVKQHSAHKVTELTVDTKELHPYEELYKEALRLLKQNVIHEKRTSLKRLKKHVVGFKSKS